MNTVASGVSLASDSVFGPSSELIDIARFVKDLSETCLEDAKARVNPFLGSEELQAEIKAELDMRCEQPATKPHDL
jgi:hypothetical protein